MHKCVHAYTLMNVERDTNERVQSKLLLVM